MIYLGLVGVQAANRVRAMSSRSEEPAYPTIIDAQPGCFVMFLTMSSPPSTQAHLPRAEAWSMMPCLL
jgi:hypothetical protein